MGLSLPFIIAFVVSATASLLILLRAVWNLRGQRRDKLAAHPN